MPAHYRPLRPTHQAWLTTVLGQITSPWSTPLSWSSCGDWMGLEGFRLQIHGRVSTLTAGAGATGLQASSVRVRAGVVAMVGRNPFCGSPIMLLPTSGVGPGAPADLRSSAGRKTGRASTDGEEEEQVGSLAVGAKDSSGSVAKTAGGRVGSEGRGWACSAGVVQALAVESHAVCGGGTAGGIEPQRLVHMPAGWDSHRGLSTRSAGR